MRVWTSLPRPLTALILLFLLVGGHYATYAQPTNDGGAVSVGGGDALTIGGLLQTDAYAGRPTGDGFRVRSTRLRFGGKAEGLQYAVQADFASSPVLLDAFARLPVTPRFRVTAGLFKTPFGGEFLTPRPDLLFAERSRVANNIPPNRQAGVTLGATLVPDRLTATVGAFNGTRGLRPNDNDLLLYVGRFTGHVPIDEGQLELGTNVAYSVDEGANLSGLGRPAFRGSRFLFGADAQLELNRWLFTGELNTGRLDAEGRSGTATPFGFHVAAGADVSEEHQLLARFDQYDPDVPAQVMPDDQLSLGYNYDPTSMLRVLLNYQAPVDDMGNGFLTARLQVALR